MKNAGKACNNRLYRHIRTFEKIIKNYFVIFHKCNIARILAVQQILHQVCSLLFRHVLRVAVGTFQECRIRMTQQGCRHLFAGAFLQQIGCVEMPQGMQVW